MDELPSLSTAIAQSSIIISLLGPQLTNRNISPTLFADIYKPSIFPLMRQHGVRRILAMGTLSIQRPEDYFSAFRFMVVQFMRTFANSIYRNMLNIAEVFDKEAMGLDWIVFRIVQILGESDEESWKRDREDGGTFVGRIGEKGCSNSQTRGALAMWLVDAEEGWAAEWVGKIPAVSRLAGSKRRGS